MSIEKSKVTREVGKRIKLARQAANLTRKQMHEKYNINTNTLQSWEKGVNSLNDNTTLKLINIFKQEGVDLTPEWLLHGILPSNNIANHHLKNAFNISEDVKILNEINYFLQSNMNAISVMIVDQSLFPLFCKGDYVAGIQINNKNLVNLVGDFCIINQENSDKVFAKKILQHNEGNNFTLGGINPLSKSNTPDYFTANILHAAKITRHWLTGNRFLQ